MNIYKKIFLFSLFLFLTKTVTGQTAPNLEVLYLKGGEFFFGRLIEEKESSIIWQLTDGTKMTIPEEKIRYFQTKKKNIQYLKKGQHKKNRGFYGSILCGSFWISNQEENNLITLHISTGYHLNKRLAVGIGAGMDIYDEQFIWPVYAEITGNIFDSSFLPYYKLAIGYAYENQSTNSSHAGYKGGVMVQPTVGFKLFSRIGAIGLFDIGYRIQKYDEFISGEEVPQTNNRIIARIGLEF